MTKKDLVFVNPCVSDCPIISENVSGDLYGGSAAAAAGTGGGYGEAVAGGVTAGGDFRIGAGEAVGGGVSAFEQQLGEGVTDGVDLGEICLIDRGFVDQSAATEDLYVVA